MRYYLPLTVYLFITALLAFSIQTAAQTWQWGRRGGCQFNGINTQPNEQIRDLATDKNGNVYALGLVESSGGADIDGHPLTLNGYKDVVLTSFSCNGTYRWSKVIGGGGNDLPVAVATDTVGHVYVSTYNQPPLSFSGDSITPANSAKGLALVAYDTAGNFKWLRQPQPDTGDYNNMVNLSDTYDLHAEGNGDVYWLVLLPPGLVSGGGGWALTAPTTCVLAYNAQGTMLSHTVLQLQTAQVAFRSIHLNRMKSGKFIVAGSYDWANNTGVFSIGGQTVNQKRMFMAAFHSSGQHLWTRLNSQTGAGSSIFSRPQIDAQGNIYYSGDCQLGDSFNGFSFYNNRSATAYTVPYVGKADSNGNHLWIKCAGGTAADVYNSISLKSNNELLMSGTANSAWWDTVHHIQGAPNSGYYIYTTRFDAGGNVVAMDSLLGTFGSNNYAWCNATDRNGNLYIGGAFNLTLNTGGQGITNRGGASDLFVAKYGYPCGCTAPVAGFSSSAAGIRTVQFTYNGTAAIDSLRWNFGDGQSQKVSSNFSTPVSHTYAGNGHYTACVLAYNACGSATYCTQYALSVGNAGLLGQVKVYPNPAGDYLVITGAAGASVSLYNVIGQQVVRMPIRSDMEVVSTDRLPSGSYLLTVQDERGVKRTMQIVKQ